MGSWSPSDVMDWLTGEDSEPDEDAVGHAGVGAADSVGDADSMDGDSVGDAAKDAGSKDAAGSGDPSMDGDVEGLRETMDDDDGSGNDGEWSPSSWLELPPFLR